MIHSNPNPSLQTNTLRTSRKVVCWLGLFWVLFFSGCVQMYSPPYTLPQVYEPSPNQPPRIIVNGINPPETFLTVKLSDPTQKTINFSIPHVLDPDEDDNLFVYWFVNRDQAPPASLRCPQAIPPVDEDKRNKPGRVPGTRETSIECAIGTEDTSRFIPGTRVILEVFVGDRQIRSGGQIPDSRGGLDWPEDANWVRWYWILRIEE
ncbi:MAG: hypothetical protein H6728_03345 [Myxococcales bacterium]|nr:hypothetical protein [Myxococcales bacterium]MCB9642085.1 hypothetical protein [Myxococcales bacterium]